MQRKGEFLQADGLMLGYRGGTRQLPKVGTIAVRTYCLKVVLLAVDFWSKSSTTFDDKVVLLLIHF